MIVVQHVRIHWTKASRGGDSARQRNAAPAAFPLHDYADAQSNPDRIALQLIDLDEPNFEPEIGRLCTWQADDKYLAGTTRFVLEEPRLRVVYRYRADDVGAPFRTSVDQSVFRLKQGQVGRLIYNGRFVGSDGHWFYCKQVLNIAWDPPAGKRLFTRPPDRVFEDCAMLR